LWVKAVTNAAYLINRCPTNKLQGKTLGEAWSGVKPSVQHLKVFGYLCFMHNPDKMRRKLDDKAQTMVLVGYHYTGVYKLYDPKSKKVVFIKVNKLAPIKSRYRYDTDTGNFSKFLI